MLESSLSSLGHAFGASQNSCPLYAGATERPSCPWLTLCPAFHLMGSAVGKGPVVLLGVSAVAITGPGNSACLTTTTIILPLCYIN